MILYVFNLALRELVEFILTIPNLLAVVSFAKPTLLFALSLGYILQYDFIIKAILCTFFVNNFTVYIIYIETLYMYLCMCPM